jgi:predicted NAD/FAD-binding protein
MQHMDVRTIVVGAGIAGLGTTWALRDDADVLVLDGRPHVGGNALTVEVDDVAVDMGFIVYNVATYPRLMALFEALDVATAPSDMSLSVQLDGTGTTAADGPRGEWAGTLGGILGNGAWRRRRSWRRLGGILALSRRMRRLAAAGATIGQARAHLGDVVVDDYLVPMVSAIWSAPEGDVEAMPTATLVTFFDQHHLFDLVGRPQWRTVVGGSRTYVDALVSSVAATFRTGAPVTRVRPRAGGTGWEVEVGHDEVVTAERIVFATPADTALGLLGEAATARQAEILGAFRSTDNRAWLHGDASVMPTDRRLWSSWNVVSGGDVAVTYWMNRLQPLATPRDLFVTLNPPRPLADVHEIRDFRHPVMDAGAAAAQRDLHTVQGVGGVWLCGAWTGYGFHEDGLESGLAVGAALAGRRPPAPGAGRPAARVVVP